LLVGHIKYIITSNKGKVRDADNLLVVVVVGYNLEALNYIFIVLDLFILTQVSHEEVVYHQD
jgi:hypothetical protein